MIVLVHVHRMMGIAVAVVVMVPIVVLVLLLRLLLVLHHVPEMGIHVQMGCHAIVIIVKQRKLIYLQVVVILVRLILQPGIHVLIH